MLLCISASVLACAATPSERSALWRADGERRALALLADDPWLGHLRADPVEGADGALGRTCQAASPAGCDREMRRDGCRKRRRHHRIQARRRNGPRYRRQWRRLSKTQMGMGFSLLGRVAKIAPPRVRHAGDPRDGQRRGRLRLPGEFSGGDPLAARAVDMKGYSGGFRAEPLAPRRARDRRKTAPPPGRRLPRPLPAEDHMIDRIDHIVLNCRNVEATVSWYERALGSGPAPGAQVRPAQVQSRRDPGCQLVDLQGRCAGPARFVLRDGGRLKPSSPGSSSPAFPSSLARPRGRMRSAMTSIYREDPDDNLVRSLSTRGIRWPEGVACNARWSNGQRAVPTNHLLDCKRNFREAAWSSGQRARWHRST
jgi:hypothetical protein